MFRHLHLGQQITCELIKHTIIQKTLVYLHQKMNFSQPIFHEHNEHNETFEPNVDKNDKKH